MSKRNSIVLTRVEYSPEQVTKFMGMLRTGSQFLKHGRAGRPHKRCVCTVSLSLVVDRGCCSRQVCVGHERQGVLGRDEEGEREGVPRAAGCDVGDARPGHGRLCAPQR